MEINNVKAMEGASGGQKTKAQPVDSVSKNIQNEISNVQRKRQELSSNEDISVEDKLKKRQEMQQEISRLNTQLRQRQAEMRREKQKDLLSEEMKKDSGKTKEAEAKKAEAKKAETKEAREAKETGKAERETKEEKGKETEKEKKSADISGMGMKEVAAADIALQQARSRRNVISGMENGIEILKGEIRQDEARGANVEGKQAALKKQEEKVQKASASQFSVLGNTYKVIVDATRANADVSKGAAGKNVKNSRDSDALIKSTNFAKEKNQSPQPFYTSFTLFG